MIPLERETLTFKTNQASRFAVVYTPLFLNDHANFLNCLIIIFTKSIFQKISAFFPLFIAFSYSFNCIFVFHCIISHSPTTTIIHHWRIQDLLKERAGVNKLGTESSRIWRLFKLLLLVILAILYIQ